VDLASSVHNTWQKQSGSSTEAINRAGGGYYCPLTAALVQILHEKDATVPHPVFIKFLSQRAVFHMQADK
jgi:hypothetical protein